MPPLWGGRGGVTRVKVALLVSALMHIATGCDRLYGVHRQARIDGIPDVACIAAVIRQAPGVEEVQYRHRKGSRPITRTGIQGATEVDTFFYRGADVAGDLQILIEYDGEITFLQDLFGLNQSVPQGLVDRSRPVCAGSNRSSKRNVQWTT